MFVSTCCSLCCGKGVALCSIVCLQSIYPFTGVLLNICFYLYMSIYKIPMWFSYLFIVYFCAFVHCPCFFFFFLIFI